MAKTKSTKITEDENLQHITILRELAIKLIHENGQWQKVGVIPVMMVKDHGSLSIVYLTPFQRRAPSYYSIDICSGRNVVLSLRWNRSGLVSTEKYRPGAWEAQLEAPAVTASLAA
jgi:hypothetical protein